MPGLIVVAFVLPQQLEYGDAAGREEAIGADDHQHHGYEEQDKRAEGIGGGQSDVIAPAQAGGAEDSQQCLGFGFPFAGLPAFEIVGLPDAAVKEARERVRWTDESDAGC